VLSGYIASAGEHRFVVICVSISIYKSTSNSAKWKEFVARICCQSLIQEPRGSNFSLKVGAQRALDYWDWDGL